MKYKYYLFKTPTEIKHCYECPAYVRLVMNGFCNALKRNLPPDDLATKPADCPLVLIEGKVEE